MRHHLLLYDGHCLMCNRSISWLLSKDEKQILRVATIENYHTLNVDIPVDRSIDSIIYVRDGQIYYRSQAVLLAMKDIHAYSRLTKLLLSIPSIIRDLFYRFIARIRYHIYPPLEHCPLPKEEHRHQYLLTSDELSAYLTKDAADQIKKGSYN